MNILIVDDLAFVVESLKNSIDWEKIGIKEVFTANSTAEAKLLITNFDIDILLTDIEMPGESGLDLMKWTIENDYSICTVFLTSHADFSYVQTALRLGGFDYIMQPVRYQDVRNIVLKAIQVIRKKKKIGHMEQTWNQLLDQRSIFFDAILRQLRIRDYNAAMTIMRQLLSALELEEGQVMMHGIRIVLKNIHIQVHREMDQHTEKMVKIVETCFDRNKERVFVGYSYEDGFYLLVIRTIPGYEEGEFRNRIKTFYKNVTDGFGAECTLYVSVGIDYMNWDNMRILADTFVKNSNTCERESCQIVWTTKSEEEAAVDYKNAVMEKAIGYIQAHMGDNITRTEVADCVGLSEEYFSKIFKQCMGMGFKEYVIEEKMKVARSLLANSELPISLIAAKLGFINFSHFSKTFKKVIDYSPQEYRRLYQTNHIE